MSMFQDSQRPPSLGVVPAVDLAGWLASKGVGASAAVTGTARVGLSAIAVCRPMPFRALPAPALADVAGSLLTTRVEPEKTAG